MKKILLGIILLFVSLLVHPLPVHAAADYAERWTCLDLVFPPSDKTIPAIPSNRLINDDNYEGSSYQKYTHSGVAQTQGMAAKLLPTGTAQTKGKSIENPLPNADTYIVECIQIPRTRGWGFNELSEAAQKEFKSAAHVPTEMCTTGDSKTDLYIWGNDRLSLLRTYFPIIGYQFIGYYKLDFVTRLEPESSNHYLKTDDKGNFKVGRFANVSFTLGDYDHKLLAYNRITDSQPPGLGGDQQGQIPFDTASKNCTKIAWDPYGRVFDAKTLEPIMGANVILKINKNNIFTQMTGADMPGSYLNNPYLTKEDASFSYIVPDGIYKLEVSAPGYTFPSSGGAVHQNYSVAYSDLYYGDDIVQKGAIVHRDIPLEPNNQAVSEANQKPPKLMGMFQTTIQNGQTVIEGRESHPLATVRSYCKKADNTKGTSNTMVQADKYGNFVLNFNPALCKIEKEEMYAALEIESRDLTQVKISNNMQGFDTLISQIKNVFHAVSATSPRTSIYYLDPIPNRIDGYAYNDNGEVLPNATVGVYAIGDTNPLRTVQTDKSGHFSLNPNNLPKSPYALKYTSGGKTTTITTSKFIAENLKTMQNKTPDLSASQQAFMSLQGNVTISPVQQQTNVQYPQPKMKAPDILSTQMQDKTKTIIFITIMILILPIFGTTALILMYMKKKSIKNPNEFS